MPLAKKKIALLIEQQYQDAEVIYPYYRLQEAGALVDLVGPKKGARITGKYGYTLIANKGIDEVKANGYDAVIIPGGFAPDYMRRDPRFAKFVHALHNKGKVVASICHGGWLLASAGILKGKTVTSFFAIKDDLVNAGAYFVDKSVARDGNIITSRQPDDLPDFCRTIIDALAE